MFNLKYVQIYICLAIVLTGSGVLAIAADIELVVRQQGSTDVMPARIHLFDSAGKAVHPADLPFFNDHFACPGRAKLKLEPGTYSYEVERGPEYSMAASSFSVEGDAAREVAIELKRLVDMPGEGWWPGETHIHRPLGDIELLMRAEDLHFAPVITWWNAKNEWAKRALPENPLVNFDGNRFYHVMGGEDERTGGALLYFNLNEPIKFGGTTPEFPSPMKFLNEAKQQKAWVDIEKPFWWDVPAWLASGQCDSFGLANNHMCRSKVEDKEAWGKPRDRQRLPPPYGNGLWTQEIYYQVLNSGIRIPPSAGSASGVLPNPVGYNRVYVYCGKETTWAKWWDALREGKCFVTNGPLLRCTANRELPGHVFTTNGDLKSITLILEAKITSRDPISNIEIIRNGRVERIVPFSEWEKTGSLGEIVFKESGWFLVRTITDNTQTFRFASSAPFYVEVGDTKTRISRTAAEFFLDWERERMKRIKLKDPLEKEEVLKPHLAAEQFWMKRVEAANAD